MTSIYRILQLMLCVCSSLAFLPLHRPNNYFYKPLFAGKGFAKSESSASPALETYPPLNKTEIQQSFAHIPIFAVTDIDSNGLPIQIGDSTVLYFFLSPVMAGAYMDQLSEILKQSGSEKKLTVSGLFLGSIWEELLQKQGTEVCTD